MALIARLIIWIIQVGILYGLFKFGITGKQAEDKPLGWFYRVLSLLLASFIVFGIAYMVIDEHKIFLVFLFQMFWAGIKNVWTKFL